VAAARCCEVVAVQVPISIHKSLVQIDSDHDLHGVVKNSKVVVYVCEDMVRQTSDTRD